MYYSTVYDLTYEDCEHLLVLGKYFNFLGQFDSDTKYAPLDTFTKDNEVMVCLTQSTAISMSTFVRILHNYDLYDRFYRLGQQELAYATTEANLTDVLILPSTESSHSENIAIKHLIQFICDPKVILHSTIESTARFCIKHNMYIDLETMNILPCED